MADLYVLTDKACYLLFPTDTSPEKPFYYTSHTGAGNAWYGYPDQLYIAAHLGILFNGVATWVQTDGAPPSPLCGLGPSPGINFPHLEKPAWLKTFLASCNWQVFTWYINPGEWIEEAIDWVLDGINDLLDLGENIANKAIEAWETLKTIWSDISDEIGRRVAPIWNEITDFADKLVNLWNDVTSLVDGLIAAISNWVSSELTYFGNLLDRLGEEWGEFWRSTFPNLIDKIAFWDNFFIGLAPIFEAINRLTDILDAFRDFFDDPEKWLLDKLETMLARFI